MELAEEWGKQHPKVILDKSLRPDRGLSAFDETNLTKGSLGQFHKKVLAKAIPEGSILLVENLDRLTRASPTHAILLFTDFVRNGIEIITTHDGKSFTEESLNENFANIFDPFLKMGRGHDESKRKRKDSLNNWKRKRAEAVLPKGKRMTAQCPGWLRLSEDRRSYIPDTKRVAIIKKIFRWKRRDKGNRWIARELNKLGEEPWGRGKRRGNGWHESYIQKLVSTRALVGEFQAWQGKGKNRTKAGNVIKGYFPEVLKPAVFNSIKHKNGLKGPATTSNLFTGIAVDGLTSAAMRFVDKGTAKRGRGKWKYLVSDARRLNASAKRVSWNYADFERLFLRYAELDWNNAVRGNDDDAVLNQLADKIEDLTTQIDELKEAEENLADACERSKQNEVLVRRLNKKTGEREGKESERALIIAESERCVARKHEHIDINKLIQNNNSEETRLALRSEIQKEVERVLLFPDGFRRVRGTDPDVNMDIVESPDRAFEIHFRNGKNRVVLADEDEALIFDTSPRQTR